MLLKNLNIFLLEHFKIAKMYLKNILNFLYWKVFFNFTIS